jgi:DsbC/DsbD-like thiol-disulfide interchange protein
MRLARYVALLLVSFMLCSPVFGIGTARAAISDWAVSDGGRMRLVALSMPRNGVVSALLQIEPKAGWKTYWRYPGDAGMAPELDFSASENLTLRSIAYPVPEIGQDAGGRFIGYHRPASLVLTFDKPDPAASSRIALKALVGICEDICLPFAADFALTLDPSAPEGEEFSAMMMAQADLPEQPAEDFAVRRLTKSADGKAVIADILLPKGETVEAAAAASRGVRLGKDPTVAVEGNTARITVPIKRIDASGAPHQITLLVKAGGRAMETTLALD